MKRSLILLSSLVAALAATAACSVERTSSVLAPSSAAATAAVAGKTSSSPSLLGTWVLQSTVSTSTVSTKAIASLPDFSSCTNFQWAVTTQTATEASGRFSADCSGGMKIAGTITAQMTALPIPIVISGVLSRESDTCPFSLTGSGLPIDSVTFRINYGGTTCLGPVQGANTLSLAPHSAPTSFTIAGTITDGTSGGILPNIEARTSGGAVRSDGAGHYEVTNIPAGAVTVQFAAAGYVTQTKTLTVSEDAVLDAVLQRVVAAPAPAPAPVPSNGDQLDLHQVIVRGPGGDVANWPVTTTIRVLDFNSGGVFVDFAKKDGPDRWPDVMPPGWGGSIQYTIWMVVNHGGQWYTAGGVEFWHGLDRGGGPPSMYAQNWYYNAQVWGPLDQHQPSVGEQVGFFVTAGDQRAKDVRLVTERSNVVVVPFPSNGGAYYPF